MDTVHAFQYPEVNGHVNPKSCPFIYFINHLLLQQPLISNGS